MNFSKIIYPSELLLNFYFSHSYVTLTVTWLITPILFYTILTQSKSMKGFKWFILNHSFWCLIFETQICLLKPLFLTPAVAGIPLAGIRDGGSFQKTAISTIIIAGCGVNFAIGLTATIATRYLLIFPSRIMKVLNIKVVTVIASCLIVGAYGAIVIVANEALTTNIRDIRSQAAEYDPFFVGFRDKSMIFFSYEIVKTFVFYFIGIVVFLFVMAFTVMFFFIHLVQTSMKATTRAAKMQKSLIISSIIQILLTSLFLILPVLFILASMAFQIPNTAEFSCFCVCLVSSYSVIDFSTTLYFVAPYRRFLIRKVKKLFGMAQPQPQIHFVTMFPKTKVHVHVIVNVIAE